MKKLLFATCLALLAAPRVTHAEEGGEPAAAEPKQAAAEGKEKAEVEEAEPDPSTHFNFTNFSYGGKDEFGGKFGDGFETTTDGKKLGEEEPMSPPFVFLLFNFALLLFIFAKYLAPAGRKVAEERHDQIKSALDEAAKLRDQAKAKLAEYETRIKGVDDEIRKLVDGIRADAEADKARILEAAAAQAAQMKKDAEQRIAAEIDLARTLLTKEVTAAAVGATEKLLKDKATPDDQRKLVSSFITGIN
jgi:F-type H+-transporting ATPase subunit b